MGVGQKRHAPAQQRSQGRLDGRPSKQDIEGTSYLECNSSISSGCCGGRPGNHLFNGDDETLARQPGKTGDRRVSHHFQFPAGGPALTIFACTIPTEGAPSLRFLQGWAAMLRVLFNFVVGTRSNPPGAGISGSRPSQKARRNGAPTVVFRPARSEAWATRLLLLKLPPRPQTLPSGPVVQRVARLSVKVQMRVRIPPGRHSRFCGGAVLGRKYRDNLLK